MSAPTIAGPLSGAFWAMAVEPEFPACKSVLRLFNGDPARSAWCDASHTETGEVLHRAEVHGHTVRWSDEDAAAHMAAFLALPECAKCGIRYVRGDFGPYCRAACQLADKHCAADDFEPETEAAA